MFWTILSTSGVDRSMLAFFCIVVVVAVGFALGVLYNNLSILQDKVAGNEQRLNAVVGLVSDHVRPEVEAATKQIERLNAAHMTVANRLDQLTPVAERVDHIAATIEGSQQDFLELTQTTDACLDELATRIAAVAKPKKKRVAARRKSK